MVTNSEFSYIPKGKINVKNSLPEVDESIILHRKYFRLFDNFKVLEREGHKKQFTIKKHPQGILFISEGTYVRDLRNQEIPQTILITELGQKLMSKYPSVLSNIEKHKHAERKIVSNSYSGEVRLVKIDAEFTVAVKDYKRYRDGRRLPVGGLEQAEAMFAINQILSDLRCPDIYVASQDTLVMEDISNKQSIKAFLELYPQLIDEVDDGLHEIAVQVNRLFEKKKLKGSFDYNRMVMRKHVFIDSFDGKTIRYILIDPNV